MINFKWCIFCSFSSKWPLDLKMEYYFIKMYSFSIFYQYKTIFSDFVRSFLDDF